MRSMTIEARSLQSARALYSALSEFQPEMTGSDYEGYRVSIELGSSDGQIVAVLDLLEKHVSERATEPARVELDGRRYTLHAR